MAQKSYLNDYYEEMKLVINTSANQNFLIEGFVNVFGKEYQELFRYHLEQTSFYSVIPYYYDICYDMTNIVYLYQNFLRDILTHFLSVFPFSIRAKLKENAIYDLKKFLFGDMEDLTSFFYKKMPLWSFLSLSFSSQIDAIRCFFPYFKNEQEAFQTFIYACLQMQKKYVPWEKYYMEVFSSHRFFQICKNLLKHPELTGNIVSLNIHDGSSEFMDDKNEVLLQFMTNLEGYNVPFIIYLRIGVSQKTLFHEFGHEISRETLLSTLKDDFYLFGCFQKGKYDLALEIFNDYFSYLAYDSVSSNLPNDEENDFSDIYGSDFFAVEKFMNYFGSLYKMAYMEHCPSLIYEVLGEKNFKMYLKALETFHQYPMLSCFSFKLMEALIHQMRKHVLNYSANYYQTVSHYIQELKGSGKKVRILKPSIEKLKKEEDIIRNLKKSLSFLE